MIDIRRIIVDSPAIPACSCLRLHGHASLIGLRGEIRLW
jgi:hypothetical protein